MESFMNGAMVVEAGLLSFLLALWMTWLGLRGIFRLAPGVNRTTASPATQSLCVSADRR